MYRRALKTVAAAALITSIMGTSVFADDLTTLKSQQQEAQQQGQTQAQPQQQPQPQQTPPPNPKP